MTNLEAAPVEALLQPGQPCSSIEMLEPREVPLGGLRAMTVYRTLPQRERSLIGAWCFLDHYGPDDVSVTGGMRVTRHPHTGLATVSWIFTGQIDHVDSSGVSAAVVPGELNLMIAGRGITHQEISSPDTTILHGVQLWFALPEQTRFIEHRFEHYVPEPVTLPGAVARVFLGSLLGSTSPVVTSTTELLGAELLLEPGASVTLDVRSDFEHGVLAENADITVNDIALPHRALAYAPPGADTLTIRAGDKGARLILLGGVPFSEQIVMWWNFIGRDHDEIIEYRRRYQSELGFEPADPRDKGKPGLFGPYPENMPAPIPAPPAPLARLKPRK